MTESSMERFKNKGKGLARSPYVTPSHTFESAVKSEVSCNLVEGRNIEVYF